MLQSVGSQRVRHDWATELNWIRCQHHPPRSNLSGIWVHAGSIQLTSPPGWGSSSCKTPSPWEGNRTWPKAALLFLDFSSLLSAALPFSISNCLNLPTRNEESFLEADWSYFLQTREWRTQKGFCAPEPHSVQLGSSVTEFWKSNSNWLQVPSLQALPSCNISNSVFSHFILSIIFSFSSMSFLSFIWVGGHLPIISANTI